MKRSWKPRGRKYVALWWPHSLQLHHIIHLALEADTRKKDLWQLRESQGDKCADHKGEGQHKPCFLRLHRGKLDWGFLPFLMQKMQMKETPIPQNSEEKGILEDTVPVLLSRRSTTLNELRLSPHSIDPQRTCFSNACWVRSWKIYLNLYKPSLDVSSHSPH